MDAEQVKLVLISGTIGVVGCLIASRILGRGGKKKRPPSGAAKGLKLYQSGICRSARCNWMLAELGIRNEVQVVEYDVYNVQAEEKQWYRENIHPHATIPALVLENKQVLTESQSICMYLAERYGELLPDDTETATYIDWCAYGANTVDQNLHQIYMNLYKKDNPLHHEAILKSASQRFDEFVLRFEKHLKGRDFICGNKFTTADVIMGYNIMWAASMKGGILIQEFDNVKAYLARLKKRKGFTSEIGTSRDWVHGL